MTDFSLIEMITNSYQEFFADKVIEIINKYSLYRSPNIVATQSPVSLLIFKISQSSPVIMSTPDPSFTLLNTYITNSVNSVTEAPNVWQNMSSCNKSLLNLSIFSYIEFTFTTSIPYAMINAYKELFPLIGQFNFINFMDFKYILSMKMSYCNDSFNAMIQHMYQKNCIYIPEGLDMKTYFNKLSIQGEILYQEYKVRINYLTNPDNHVSQQYFYDLVVKYRCKFIQILGNIPNPLINKSTILTILFENNMLNFKDFGGYNWHDLTNTFFWSAQENTANANWFRCKETDFSTVSNIFQEIKNKELANFSQDPTQYRVSTERIGFNNHINATPNNYLVGILYDDTVDSANLRYISSQSKIN